MSAIGNCAWNYHPLPFLTSCVALSPVAHWDEKFHHKMVDNRGFMVTRSYTVGVPMMHRTGEWETSCPTPRPAGVRITVLCYPGSHQLPPRWFCLMKREQSRGVFVLLIQSLCKQRESLFTIGCLAVGKKPWLIAQMRATANSNNAGPVPRRVSRLFPSWSGKVQAEFPLPLLHISLFSASGFKVSTITTMTRQRSSRW